MIYVLDACAMIAYLLDEEGAEVVESALLEDRVSSTFELGRDGSIQVGKVTSQKNQYSFEPTDFVLALKTAALDRYWLDTGVFEVERA